MIRQFDANPADGRIVVEKHRTKLLISQKTEKAYQDVFATTFFLKTIFTDPTHYSHHTTYLFNQ